MKSESFDLFATLLRQRAGMLLTRDCAYMLESRLQPVTRKWNSRTVDDLAQAARDRRDEPLLLDIVEALLPAETSFLFGSEAMTTLQQTILPALAATRTAGKQLRFWVAGCSTGQEAYSLALLLAEAEAQWRDWTIEIVATDLSHAALARAQSGLYTHFEAQRGLPAAVLVKHFTRVTRPDGMHWQLAEGIRTRVSFGPLNLLHDAEPQLALAPLQTQAPFDLILCRNVLGPFDGETRSRVLDRLAGMLAADGLLLLGQNEPSEGGRLRPADGPAVYRRA